ncbi:pentapeptide repeat-containing protein [Cystobacter fuscus]|nr:pentapeptide repeat-containing protein [Cystobacter fuscus]
MPLGGPGTWRTRMRGHRFRRRSAALHPPSTSPVGEGPCHSPGRMRGVARVRLAAAESHEARESQNRGGLIRHPSGGGEPGSDARGNGVESGAMRLQVHHGRFLSLLLLLGAPALSGCLSEREKTVRRLLETRECEGCDLKDASLEGANLEGARLKGATLMGAVLARANLRNADLTEAGLEGVDARQADLRGARLDDARLLSAQLQGATLEGVDLRNAKNLESVNFEGANLRGVNLEDSSLYGQSGPYRRSKKRHLYDVPGGGALVRRADLSGANLRDATLANCDFAGAIFRGADLRDANLELSNLEGADLTEARLSGASWTDESKCGKDSVGRCIPTRSR